MLLADLECSREGLDGGPRRFLFLLLGAHADHFELGHRKPQVALNSMYVAMVPQTQSPLR